MLKLLKNPFAIVNEHTTIIEKFVKSDSEVYVRTGAKFGSYLDFLNSKDYEQSIFSYNL